MKTFLQVLVASLLLAAGPAFAQLKLPAQKPAAKPASKPAAEKPAAVDELGKYIEDRFKKLGGWSLCIGDTTPVSEVRAEVAQEAKRRGGGKDLTPAEVDVALATRYPCPFSPHREELRPATAKDVEGVWLFPEPSQPFRFGPKSPDQPGGKGVAIKCEIVGYYAGGEFRNGVLKGEDTCPFSSAAHLEPARSRPKVLSWSMLRDGRLSLVHASMADLAQEWDIYVVTRPFTLQPMEFKAGDLVAYLRREKGNDINAATEFRHLQRLP